MKYYIFYRDYERNIAGLVMNNDNKNITNDLRKALSFDDKDKGLAELFIAEQPEEVSGKLLLLYF